ncbi:biofilm regulation protein phosphatase SiaA [Craterilacuibacter sp.]|uniref:biofilm regulation protein phosphatase SiaA n=1 Tax=Craterilacuibacter sp. TaxID=2870909 RepID=UPI003F387EDA
MRVSLAQFKPDVNTLFRTVRRKAVVAVLLAALGVLLLALLAGGMLLDRARHHFASSYIVGHVELKRLNLLVPIQRELVLAQKMADSPTTRAFMRNDDDPAIKRAFFAEAESFRRLFADHSYFASSSGSHHFYFNDSIKPFSPRARYTLSRQNQADSWFFASLKQQNAFNLNVNYDQHVRVTKAWVNVRVAENGQPLGMVGTGFELTRFLYDYVQNAEPGVSSMIIDSQASILAHPDPARIVYNATGKQGQDKPTLARYLSGHDDARALQGALTRLSSGASTQESLSLTLDGKPQLLAISIIPELEWFAVSAIDPTASRVVDGTLVSGVVIAMLTLVLMTLLLVVLGFDQLLLKPIARLTASVRQMAAGNYTAKASMPRNDEIGELASAFDEMAQQVQAHTQELEHKVSQRTQQLTTANLVLSDANRKINDSIRYASLIQHGILPERALQDTLHNRHLLLWRPRDVVGGDFYLFTPTAQGYLFGLIDCAGHGVSGALMTMQAYAAFQSALDEGSAEDPADLLSRMDDAARTRFSSDAANAQVSTTMDAALCHINFASGNFTFAGAHMDLYTVDGEGVTLIRGARRALGEKRVIETANHQHPLRAGLSLYLSSDGLLDQNGGESGYGFGRRRFEAVLAGLQALPWAQRSARLQTILADYQQDKAQLDDIAVLGTDASPNPI